MGYGGEKKHAEARTKKIFRRAERNDFRGVNRALAAREQRARNRSSMSQKRGASNMEIFIALGVVVLWIALQTWILPRFGVST